ncbi:MAG: hypothetical protein O3B31_12055 [Chloroflexi bacterium]|nr:hypothetical protein [Chloroflexota bacterium]
MRVRWRRIVGVSEEQGGHEDVVTSRLELGVELPVAEQEFKTHGRIFATQNVVTDVLTVTPLLAVGAMTGAFGPRASFAFVATLGLGFLLVLEVMLRRRRPVLEPIPARI